VHNKPLYILCAYIYIALVLRFILLLQSGAKSSGPIKTSAQSGFQSKGMLETYFTADFIE